MTFCLMLAGALPVAAKVPDWAIGTFTGRNPQNGSTIILTINSNGNVIADFGGGFVSYGTLDNKTLKMGNDVARISKTNNGIRATSRDSRGVVEVIEYVRSNWNNGNNGNNDDWDNQSGKVPSWAVGTFYGTNPQNGTPITLTIQSNGHVSINMNGAVNSASMYKDQLKNGPYTARITRLNNGIRATSNGEAIDYYRNYNGGNNGNNDGDWNSTRPMGQVPSWAIGTFRGTNPQNGTPITLTIQSNGIVTINMNGTMSSATMYKDQLYNNGDTAKATKIRNGVRFTSAGGQAIDYYR